MTRLSIAPPRSLSGRTDGFFAFVRLRMQSVTCRITCYFPIAAGINPDGPGRSIVWDWPCIMTHPNNDLNAIERP